MNITNLLPGVYTVRVIDNIFNCEDTESFTILPVDPITVISTGGSSPSPVLGASSVADYKVELVCPGIHSLLKFKLKGEVLLTTKYNWTLNGGAIGQPGVANQLTASQPGIYNVEAYIDLLVLMFHINLLRLKWYVRRVFLSKWLNHQK